MFFSLLLATLVYYFLAIKQAFGDYIKERTRFRKIEMFDRNGRILFIIDGLTVETNLIISNSDYRSIDVCGNYYAIDDKIKPNIEDSEMPM